jgi:hypothetical protein
MASTISPLVQQILAFRSELHVVSDELRTRVQSIRVRSNQEVQSSQGWRHRPNTGTSPQSTGNRWRHNDSFRPNQQLKPIQRANSFYSNSSVSSPTATPISPTPISPAPMRYVSRFHNGAKKGDDKILNTVIMNKLNIFSVKTYDDVKQFLFQILGSDQREFVREFTWLVFRRAAAEEKFCALFAKLLSEIKKEYPVILEEMLALHTKYLDIWKIRDTPDINIDKRCRLGYSQFLAELTALEVLDSNTMKSTIEMLKTCIVECLSDAAFKETIEEYMDCLKQLCSSKVPKLVRKTIKELLVSDLDLWIKEDAPGLSSKSRFACMDLRDLLLK